MTTHKPPYDDVHVSELLNVMYARRDALTTAGFHLATRTMQRQIDTTLDYAALARQRKEAKLTCQ